MLIPRKIGFTTSLIVFVTLLQAQEGIFPMVDYSAARQRLIDEVLVPGGITDVRVLESVQKTDRHQFVPAEVRDQAYQDRSLPIGATQTISSPYIVAVMTQELVVHPDHKVLEIGTGSGYQAAILSPLVRAVYTIEIVPELGKQAAKVLNDLGYKNIHTKIGDGFLGWQEHAPFDRIIVTCSPENVPQPLIDQLAEDGLMIIPVGERYQQMLYLLRKKNGKLEREALRPTLFVPMTGQAEDNRQVKADPGNPALVNGDFQSRPLSSGDIPGWYYQRGLNWKSDSGLPDENYVEFENNVPGRPTQLLQGVPLDGRLVKRIKLSAQVRTKSVRPGLDRNELPAVTIRFYDQSRTLLATQFLGPFQGTSKWRRESRNFKVPQETREAIVALGLFGATGTAAFDKIDILPVGH